MSWAMNLRRQILFIYLFFCKFWNKLGLIIDYWSYPSPSSTNKSGLVRSLASWAIDHGYEDDPFSILVHRFLDSFESHFSFHQLYSSLLGVVENIQMAVLESDVYCKPSVVFDQLYHHLEHVHGQINVGWVENCHSQCYYFFFFFSFSCTQSMMGVDFAIMRPIWHMLYQQRIQQHFSFALFCSVNVPVA